MTGLIWLVQLVHYPAFHFVERKSFSDFHRFHSNRISWIVAPVMMLELLSSYFLLAQSQFAVWAWGNFLIVVLLFLLTATVSMPIHNRLTEGYNETDVNRLINTNWLRTALWSLRTLAILIAVVNDFVGFKAALF